MAGKAGTTTSTFEMLNMTPIPVIASFSDDGKIMPLYVKINGERYKIASYWSERLFRTQTIFHCRIEDHGLYKTINLTYFMSECVWGM